MLEKALLDFYLFSLDCYVKSFWCDNDTASAFKVCEKCGNL